MARMSYGRAVAWIALNDEPGATTEEMADLISVVMVADLSGRAPEQVARDVMNRRKRDA